MLPGRQVPSRVLVGHHVSCDQAFLEREFARIGVRLPPVPLLCTRRLARGHLPGAGGLGLAACVAAAGLGWYPAHSALGDARATVALLRHCMRTPSAAPTEWAGPLREAAEVPWPRLTRALSRRRSGGLPLVLRRAPFGPWPLGAHPSGPVRTALGGE
ncbi:3'-5' exonuclease [Kitasatospora sp. HPMI-4]|uniref:3'-5' exonuclease n=1 Tax=Kitasatospora sp. HPMI-4 TaxID=3448443 RepID=UPI003F1DA00E